MLKAKVVVHQATTQYPPGTCSRRSTIGIDELRYDLYVSGNDYKECMVLAAVPVGIIEYRTCVAQETAMYLFSRMR